MKRTKMSVFDNTEWDKEKQVLLELVHTLLDSKNYVTVSTVAHQTERFLHSLRNKISLVTDQARTIPTTLLLLIFSFLPFEEIYPGRRICKAWSQILHWHNLERMHLLSLQVKGTSFLPEQLNISACETGVYCMMTPSYDQDFFFFKSILSDSFRALHTIYHIPHTVKLLAYSQGILYLCSANMNGYFLVSVNANEGFKIIEEKQVSKPLDKIFVRNNRIFVLSFVPKFSNFPFFRRCWFHDIKHDPDKAAIWTSEDLCEVAVAPHTINRFFISVQEKSEIQVRSISSGELTASLPVKYPPLALTTNEKYLFSSSQFGIHIFDFEGRQLGQLLLFPRLYQPSSWDSQYFPWKIGSIFVSACHNHLYLHYKSRVFMFKIS